MVANWLHTASKLVISFFQYSPESTKSPLIHSGYIKTEENFADTGIPRGFCARHSFTASRPKIIV